MNIFRWIIDLYTFKVDEPQAKVEDSLKYKFLVYLFMVCPKEWTKRLNDNMSVVKVITRRCFLLVNRLIKEDFEDLIGCDVNGLRIMDIYREKKDEIIVEFKKV